jgi:hypothetical protein
MLKRITDSPYAQVGLFVTSGSKSYFFAGDGTSDSIPVDGYIWRTDGTSSGTQRYVESANEPYAMSDGYLYFHKKNSQQVIGLWRINLSNETQTEIRTGKHQIYPSSGGVFIKGLDSLTFINSASSQAEVIESWSTQSTYSDPEIEPIGYVSESSIRPISSGLFYQKSGTQGYRFSNGTTEGTRTLVQGESGGLSAPFSAAKIMLFEDDSSFGLEPFILDSQLGTRTLLKDASPGVVNSYYQDLGHGVMPPAVINGKLYFDMIVHGGGADSYGGGGVSEIWESDGTSEGTRRITNFAQISDGPRYSHCLFASGDFVYFGAVTSSSGRELWAIDTRELVSSGPSAAATPVDNNTSLPDAGNIVASPSPSQPRSLDDVSKAVSPQVLTAVSIPRGAITISRKPSVAFAKKLLVTVNGLKALVTLEPPTATIKNSKIVSYSVRLRPTRGKVITKVVLTRSLKNVKVSANLMRNMSYQMTITALHKSGKSATWKGPILLSK